MLLISVLSLLLPRQHWRPFLWLHLFPRNDCILWLTGSSLIVVCVTTDCVGRSGEWISPGVSSDCFCELSTCCFVRWSTTQSQVPIDKMLQCSCALLQCVVNKGLELWSALSSVVCSTISYLLNSPCKTEEKTMRLSCVFCLHILVLIIIWI